MGTGKEFRNCFSDDCYDCPHFEECHGMSECEYFEDEGFEEPYGDEDRNMEMEEDEGFEDPYDDGDSWAMELVENEDFAHDGEFENMPPEGYGDEF